jgi:hypothetical protein
MTEDQNLELKQLKQDWGDTYSIGFAAGHWWASRPEHGTDPLIAHSPDELAGMMRTDAGRGMTPERALLLAGQEPAQWQRLMRFSERYPKVLIGPDQFRTRSAEIPEASGKTVIVRHRLEDLLDALEERLGDRRERSDGPSG